MSGAYPCLVLAAPVGLAVDFVGHTLAALMTSGRRVAGALIAGMVAGLVAVVVVSALALSAMEVTATESLVLLGFNVFIYVPLAYGYLNFVNLNMTSVRIRLLQELLLREGGLTREAILKQYNAEEMIARRIVRLTRQKHLVEREGRFYSQDSVLLPVARFMDFLKWFILGHGNRLVDRALKAEKDRQTDL